MELGLKARLFIDVLQQVKFGSDETTCKERVFDKYCDELELKPEYIELAKKRLKAKERFNEDSQFHKFGISCMLVDIASEEIQEAKKFLVDNGYLFENRAEQNIIPSNSKTKATFCYTGVTAKGWEVAPKYLNLIK